MDECAFCDIVAGEADAAVVYDGDRTTAFLDANPATRGHTLVVPDDHVAELATADERTVTAVSRTARAIAAAMDPVLDPDGFSAFHTSGRLVGAVDHAHLHLVPRYDDDEISLALDRTSLTDHRPDEWLDAVRSEL